MGQLGPENTKDLLETYCTTITEVRNRCLDSKSRSINREAAEPNAMSSEEVRQYRQALLSQNMGLGMTISMASM